MMNSILGPRTGPVTACALRREFDSRRFANLQRTNAWDSTDAANTCAPHPDFASKFLRVCLTRAAALHYIEFNSSQMESSMLHDRLSLQLIVLFGALGVQACFASPGWTREKTYTSEFLGEDSFTTVGDNYFLPIIPGDFQVLETPNGKTKVTVTVTNR